MRIATVLGLLLMVGTGCKQSSQQAEPAPTRAAEPTTDPAVATLDATAAAAVDTTGWKEVTLRVLGMT